MIATGRRSRSDRQEARTSGIFIGALSADFPAGGGIPRFAGELLRQLTVLERDSVGLVSSPRVPEGSGARLQRVGPPLLGRGNFAGNAARLVWHQTVLPGILRSAGASLFYSTTTDGMVRPACAQVVTVHDLIPLLHPESAPRLKHHFRHVVPRIIAASAGVIAMSRATAADLERLYGVPRDRVHVVYQGYRDDVFNPDALARAPEVARRFKLGRYLLSTADGRSYKNLPRLLKAFESLNPAGVQLALVGRTSRKELDLEEMAAAMRASDRVRFLGFVSDEDLAALYAGAEAFVFPSLYEGFGIPPLEAMACGCPAIVAERASIPEVCGDAAVYVDPVRSDDIASAIERVLADAELRRGLRAAGLQRAACFSYRRAAHGVLDVLRQYGAEGGPLS